MIAENSAISSAPFGDVDPATGQIIAELVAKLRPYQNTGLRISRDLFHAGVRRQLLVNPTGTGKTVFFATLPIFHQFKRRILVHRDTLAKQAKKKIELWNPGVSVGVEQGPCAKASLDTGESSSGQRKRLGNSGTRTKTTTQ